MLRAMTAPVAHVLVVEDEAAIAETVLYALRSEGYAASHCLLGGEALQRLQDGGIDLLVLDVGLPDLGGFEVCRRLRALPGAVAQLPVIFLTARNDELDRVLGLELGADDYMTKPFSPRELVARVRARLRRVPAPVIATPGPAEDGGWRETGAFAIDREGRRIRFQGQPLELTRYEYALLDALLQRPGAILSRAQLMDRGWDSSADSADRTVDTHVKTLRAKLRAAGASDDPIRTHRGVGYALQV
ncbi:MULTISPECIES: two-component system response regulator CreB [Stenotrophomonas]|uniref:two-component system response regulator CreB n=1 Tax=Stenotrophomonas TaxID=40323 RepID=UPI000D53EF56|nr:MULTISPECIES: two-component system response regulator CreB [Stenotrophomonas]AWH20834.1 two-component system response regulator CreB [Stenotrophomonas sp. ZAC14D2_NAIMI4_6]AWH28559.1 two-component system response regulator CreB [Stenotrophomonas sp. YAU14A_MKIMI4_1]AWH32554.1 two-component system response regulator CreB [Stenotrophomonas sp. SAU14A_NAIMI4_8]MBK0027606.1 two-component system response regulator CreB [Stenotrophomonas sp. S48]MBK0049764.1 two-component system response regulato